MGLYGDPRDGRSRRDPNGPALVERESVVVSRAQELGPSRVGGERGGVFDRVVRLKLVLSSERETLAHELGGAAAEADDPFHRVPLLAYADTAARLLPGTRRNTAAAECRLKARAADAVARNQAAFADP